jgi:hypothetical protein
MRNIKWYKWFLHLMLGVIITGTSCDRGKLKDHIGPSLCATESFAFTAPLTANSTQVDLSLGNKVNITASFNEEVAWTILITGQSSAAQKTIIGRSSGIGIDWSGNADEGFPFFTTETCTITLTVSCKDPVSTSVSIKANNFNKNGVLLQNFDGSGQSSFGAPPYGTNYDASQSGIKNIPVSSSPQGGNYYRIVGDSKGTPTWFFGGTYSLFNLSSLAVKDATKIYFNVFVNGNGNPNSLVSFTFTENGTPKTYNVVVNWVGWKMVSFKLSDAGIIFPNKVSQVDVGLGAYPNQGTSAEVNFDFAIITENASFYQL